MAVELIATSVSRYQGLENDTKPNSPPIGSTFQELDGWKQHWSFTTGGWRVESGVVRVESVTSFERDALDVLERIQQHLAKINEGENLAEGDRHYGNS
ncbi:MAG: hypothetical protein V3S68_03330 [Dehalococcoidia bacterium]